MATKKTSVPKTVKAKTSTGREYSTSSNSTVNAINKARAQNIDSGKSAYSGAGATRASASAGKGGYQEGADYSSLPDFSGGSTPANVTSAVATPTATPQAPQSAVAPSAIPPNSMAPQAPVTAPVATPAASATPVQNRYQAGLSAAQASGLPAPQSAGEARGATGSYIPSAAPDTTAVDQFMSQDPAINTLMQSITELLNPKNQTSTLMQDYKNLYKQSGLKDINEELIDTETILDGTEDDIRNEIQTAGGFGTESQVQAMTLSRNKGMLKRYNQLVQMKTDATNQLNTMMSLNAQDKEMAQKKIDTQISSMFNLANFRQNALNNTRSQYQWMAEQMGADGLYNSLSQDPRQLAFAESILGTGPGGLQKIGAAATAEKARKAYIEQQQLAIQQGQLAVSQGNLAVSRGNLALSREQFNYDKNKPQQQNAVQLQVQGYADRVNEADAVIDKLGGKFTGPQSLFAKIAPNLLKSADRQQYDQAKRNFINAVLRRESGAAIGKDEFESADKQYFPQTGDADNTIAQKASNRQTVINNLYDQAGASRGTLPGQVIQAGDGSTYQVGNDGFTLTPLKL